MNNIIQTIKKTVLFLFGVLLIIWGYKVNATNNDAKAQDEKDKTAQESEKQPDITLAEDTIKQPKTSKTDTEPATQDTGKKKQPVAPAKSKNDSVPTVKKQPVKKDKEEPVKKVEETKETVIETATPEEASGTE